MYVKARFKYTKYKSQTKVTKRAAKAIVRRAGPLERSNFVDSDRTDAVLFPNTAVPPGAASAVWFDSIGVFNQADWVQQALAQRERIQVRNLEFRWKLQALINGTAPVYATRHIMWNLVKCQGELATELFTNQEGPWGQNFASYGNRSIHTLRRGRFIMNSLGNTEFLAHQIGGQRVHKDMTIKTRKPFWMNEDDVIVFFYQVWTVQHVGLAAELPGIVGSHDTLVRYARY